MKHFSHIIILVFVLLSCEELEVVNPADPNYKLTPPTLLNAEALTDVSIELRWKNNEVNTREYVINRKSSSETYLSIATVDKSTLRYTDTTCQMATSYIYVVQAQVENNLSANSNSIQQVTSFAAPSDLTATPLSDSELRLSWTDNTDYEKGFSIERSAGSGFVEVGAVSPNVKEYTDTGLVLDNIYDYRLAAYTDNNKSAYTSVTTATEFPAPSNLTATSISDSEIELSWVDNTGYETGFKIERYVGNGFVVVGTVGSDITEYIDNELTYGEIYEYRVAAYTSVNTSGWATITAVTKFSAPSNLSATPISETEIVLSWTDNTDVETGSKIQRDDGSGFVEIGTVPENITDFTDSGLTYGHNYSYRVAAYTASTTSVYSNTATVSTAFPAPSNLSGSPVSDSEIVLSWIDNTVYEVGFKIERDGGGGFSEIGTVTTDGTEYIDTELTFGIEYEYRVVAYSPSTQSEYSNIVRESTEFPAPSNLTATPINDSEIELIWTDNNAYEEGYIVERDNGSGFAEIVRLNTNVTEYTDTGLTYGGTYEYRVAAYTIVNVSNYSPSVQTTACLNCLVDYDGNIYGTIQIGDQVWMTENLRVTHYRDGTPIPNLIANGDWAGASSGAYCGGGEVYGAYYNWFAVMDSRNLAPEGWHVPTDEEWKELEMALGMSRSEADSGGERGTNEGSKLAGNAAISWPGGALANNDEFASSGFTALPAGYRYYHDGLFERVGTYAYFWCATSVGTTGILRVLTYSFSGVIKGGFGKASGQSVRLLRD